MCQLISARDKKDIIFKSHGKTICPVWNVVITLYTMICDMWLGGDQIRKIYKQLYNFEQGDSFLVQLSLGHVLW